MFLAYLDASGRPNFEEKENYVLASVITNERNWPSIENGIKQIKICHFPYLNESEVEFHAKDMVNHAGIYRTLGWDKIYSIFDDIFKFIGDQSNEFVIIAVLIDKTKLHHSQDPEVWAHRLLFERINSFLGRQNLKLVEVGWGSEFGISITDSEGQKKDQNLRNKLIGMLRKGTAFSKLDYLIEDPLFTDSKWRNLSQLVDCVAYCIRKEHRVNTWSFHNQHWKEYYEQVEKKFDSPFGAYKNYGLKIWPSDET